MNFRKAAWRTCRIRVISKVRPTRVRSFGSLRRKVAGSSMPMLPGIPRRIEAALVGLFVTLEVLPSGRPPKIVVNSDFLKLISLLNRDVEDLSEVKIFVDAISGQADSLGGIVFKHCPREQNCVAHCIAREGAGFTRHTILCNLG